MHEFPLCNDCQTEYNDESDRRFHAETIACPACGPHISLCDQTGKILAKREDAITQSCLLIRSGHILAVKGLGGFQLWSDALSHEAVQTLRSRKHRPRKPFAVLFPSIATLREHCLVSPKENALLRSTEAPIVLLKKKPSFALTSLIAPDNPYVGAMLPYTPLHHLLMAELLTPVIATSGNRSDEPIVIDQDTALQRLHGIADAFLTHNRPIARPVDDSVVRTVNHEQSILRRARGYVPRPLLMNTTHDESAALGTTLAVGGQLKSTVAITTHNQVILSQHIGDLSTREAYSQFEQTVTDQLRLFNVQPRAVACDLHPDYHSTLFAHQLGKRLDIPIVPVQHHHAHIVSSMVEHGLQGPVLGVAWDGAGYGPDGTLWGGEFLRCDYSGFERIAHLQPFRLPGGETCMREPRRVAFSLLYEVFGEETLDLDCPPLHSLGASLAKSLATLMDKQVHCPSTTSMGRLFDGISSLLGLCQISTFEGEAAMALEFEGHKGQMGKDCSLETLWPLSNTHDEHSALTIDWRPYIKQLVRQHHRNSAEETARQFHQHLTDIIIAIAEKVESTHIVLSGGVFQNVLLTSLAVAKLQTHGFSVYTSHKAPPNDGGLALGQAMICRASKALQSQ